MASCRLCSVTSENISEGIGVCLDCIRARQQEALTISAQAHTASRKAFGLPEVPPPLLASTLLVPGYIDVREVRDIARFIADL